MNEMHPPYDAFAVGSGAAGVGVGAAVQRARSRREMAEALPRMAYDTGGMAPGMSEHSSPYPVFAVPGSQQRMYDIPQGDRYATATGNPAHDILEAAGIGAGTHVASVHTPTTAYSDLSRNKSQGTRSLYGPGTSSHEHTPSESYAAHYQPGYQHVVVERGDEDAYGGYIGSSQPPPLSPQAPLKNPHSPGVIPPPLEGSGSEYSEGEDDNGKQFPRGSKASFRDEEDYELERGNRVLKVSFCAIPL